MCHVNYGTSSDMFSSVDDKLECNFDLVSNPFTADFVLTKAESATLSCAWRALTPADWTNTSCAMFTFWIAEGSALNFILLALKRNASGTAI